jgi:hypothetical protein
MVSQAGAGAVGSATDTRSIMNAAGAPCRSLSFGEVT